MGNDGATTVPAVPVRIVYGSAGVDDERLPWIPFPTPSVYCQAIEDGESPAFVLIAGLGFGERN